MNLMNLIRSIGFLSIGWTIFALGMGALGVWTRSPSTVDYFLPEHSHHQVLTLGKPESIGEERVHLVDRVTGKSEPIRLPSEEVWALLTVSPWRDKNGNLEVVGRWSCHNNRSCDQPFSGLGLFRLPDATVVSRIPLEVVPTGRPCLLPGLPGEILFPSGSGQLHRCNLTKDSQADAHGSLQSEEDDGLISTRAARPVRWNCRLPGTGHVNMTDPLSSPDSSLRNYVFVSLSVQERIGSKRKQEPHKLWWLRMNYQFDEIQAAGPLTFVVKDRSAIQPVAERFPSIAADADGKRSLIYMTHTPPQRSWRLHIARLDQNLKTGEPQLLLVDKPPVAVAEGLAAEPPLISADAKHVFARAATGELTTISLDDKR